MTNWLLKLLGGRQTHSEADVPSSAGESAIPSNPALSLAGVVLAQAAWKVSEFPEGELLAPFAIVERNGQKEIFAFEAATQDAAITKGKSAMAKFQRSADAWAFAREGLIRENGVPVDVLMIEFWTKGMRAPANLVQRYTLQRQQPMTAKDRFKITGEPVLIIGGVVQPPEVAKPLLTTLLQGVHQHPAVTSLWSTWV